MSDQKEPNDRMNEMVTAIAPQTHPVDGADEIRVQICDLVARCRVLKREALVLEPGVSVVPVPDGGCGV